MVLHPLDVRFDYVLDHQHARSAAYRALQSANKGDAVSAAAELAELVPLHQVAISLSGVRVAGKGSWGEVFAEAAAEWKPQLLQQLTHVVCGLPVVHSIAHIWDGLKRVVLAPLRPAPLRGLEHGSVALGRAVAIESLTLTALALECAQLLLEQLRVLLATASAEVRERGWMAPAAAPSV